MVLLSAATHRCGHFLSSQVLALPFHTYIEEYEIRRVCSSIQQTLIQLGYLQGCASLAECPADDSEPVHVAVIGVGGWGLNHVKALASLNLLYAVCDHVCLYSLAGTTHVCASHASEPESCQMFVDQDRSVLTRVKEDFPDVVVYHQYSVLLDDSKVRVLIWSLSNISPAMLTVWSASGARSCHCSALGAALRGGRCIS